MRINIFLPLTIDTARIRGWESIVRSPRLFRRLQAHLAFSNQMVQGRGGVTGGLTDFSPPGTGYFYLDHDQRNTLNTGYTLSLPWNLWTAGNFYYGSGFLNGDGPQHFPGHATFSFSIDKQVTDAVSLRFTAINIGNVRYLLDKSNTFGGTHFNAPRQFIVQLHYNFHF